MRISSSIQVDSTTKKKQQLINLEVLKNERGLTLIEVLLSLVLGSLVLIVAIFMVTVTYKQYNASFVYNNLYDVENTLKTELGVYETATSTIVVNTDDPNQQIIEFTDGGRRTLLTLTPTSATIKRHIFKDDAWVSDPSDEDAEGKAIHKYKLKPFEGTSEGYKFDTTITKENDVDIIHTLNLVLNVELRKNEVKEAKLHFGKSNYYEDFLKDMKEPEPEED